MEGERKRGSGDHDGDRDGDGGGRGERIACARHSESSSVFPREKKEKPHPTPPHPRTEMITPSVDAHTPFEVWLQTGNGSGKTFVALQRAAKPVSGLTLLCCQLQSRVAAASQVTRAEAGTCSGLSLGALGLAGRCRIWNLVVSMSYAGRNLRGCVVQSTKNFDKTFP